MKLAIESGSERETWQVGTQIAKMLRPGSVVCLYGPLGAGKTVFAKAVAAALGVQEVVTSPSFVFVHEYRGSSGPVFHIDLYRVESAADAAELGLDDYLWGDGIVIVEWADRLSGDLPDETIDVRIDFANHGRTIEISGRGLDGLDAD
jgi:tRNA threonylcarbamoyladenosine biosynthesis protein TsaE